MSSSPPPSTRTLRFKPSARSLSIDPERAERSVRGSLPVGSRSTSQLPASSLPNSPMSSRSFEHTRLKSPGGRQFGSFADMFGHTSPSTPASPNNKQLPELPAEPQSPSLLSRLPAFFHQLKNIKRSSIRPRSRSNSLVPPTGQQAPRDPRSSSGSTSPISPPSPLGSKSPTSRRGPLSPVRSRLRLRPKTPPTPSDGGETLRDTSTRESPHSRASSNTFVGDTDCPLESDRSLAESGCSRDGAQGRRGTYDPAGERPPFPLIQETCATGITAMTGPGCPQSLDRQSAANSPRGVTFEPHPVDRLHRTRAASTSVLGKQRSRTASSVDTDSNSGKFILTTVTETEQPAPRWRIDSQTTAGQGTLNPRPRRASDSSAYSGREDICLTLNNTVSFDSTPDPRLQLVPLSSKESTVLPSACSNYLVVRPSRLSFGADQERPPIEGDSEQLVFPTPPRSVR